MRDPFRLYDTDEYRSVHSGTTIPFPKMLIMQASSYCNFNCLQCPRQVKVSRRTETGLGEGFMSMDLVRKAADEFRDEEGFLGVLFALYGEPLMNREIVEMVRIVKAAGKKVQITTNGFFLDESLASRLLDAGLDKIKISFQGTTEKHYAFWRNNPHYNRVTANVRRLLDLRERMRYPLFVQIGTSVAEDTDEEIDAFMRRWDGIGDHVYYEPTGMLHLQDMAYVRGRQFRHQAVRRQEKCFDIFMRMAVLYNGIVPLCVDDEEHSMGNLHEETIRTIWNGRKFEENRRIVLTKGNVLPPCRFCYTAPRSASSEPVK